MLTRLIVCLDGVGPDYLAQAAVPTLDELGRRGWRTVGQSAVPAVTNVNNVSIITGGPPALHGITANYYLDRVTGQAVYMEAADFILAPTMFEAGTRAGPQPTCCSSKSTRWSFLRTKSWPTMFQKRKEAKQCGESEAKTAKSR